MGFRKRSRRGEGISLLVPFRCGDKTDRRAITWEWLKQYWAYELPGAEIVIGNHEGGVFSKTTAVNCAAMKAHGDVFVILDADCYLSGDVILDCATQIRAARSNSQRVWFMPYRRFYRLNQFTSDTILCSDPKHPRRFFGMPPSQIQLDRNADPGSGGYPTSVTTGKTGLEKHGHWFGALIQIMPREAFFIAGMMDERFAGWGGEDVSFMHTVDTLYARHHTTPNGVLHLWHPLSQDNNKNRMWDGQTTAGTNGRLATRYGHASDNFDTMQALVNEHFTKPKKHNVFVRIFKWLMAKLKKNFERVCSRLVI